jgi:hypothetical protein
MLKVLLDLFWRHIISWNNMAKIMIIILVCKTKFETKSLLDYDVNLFAIEYFGILS